MTYSDELVFAAREAILRQTHGPYTGAATADDMEAAECAARAALDAAGVGEMLEAAKAVVARPVSSATGGRLVLEVDLLRLERAIAKAEGRE